MDRLDESKNLLVHSNDFVLPDFIDHVADFDPFIDLIPEEAINSIMEPGFNIGDSAIADRSNVFGFNDPGFVLMGGFPRVGGENQEEEHDDDDDDDEDDSSATTNTTPTTPTKKTKVDRSRTLISERRRRGRMKEKLYALRSLVPNITKMDKASIVGDAVLYVQDLQSQAKKLKTEIAGLEASLAGAGGAKQYPQVHGQPESFTNRRIHDHVPSAGTTHPICRKILQMDVFQVEERGFYVRVVSNRGPGVAASLYKALESLTTFNVQSSNLASTSPDRFILTFTLMIKEGEPDMNLPNLKLWITGALLNQGFELV